MTRTPRERIEFFWRPSSFSRSPRACCSSRVLACSRRASAFSAFSSLSRRARLLAPMRRARVSVSGLGLASSTQHCLPASGSALCASSIAFGDRVVRVVRLCRCRARVQHQRQVPCRASLCVMRALAGRPHRLALSRWRRTLFVFVAPSHPLLFSRARWLDLAQPRPSGRLAVWLSGCLAVWLSGCLAGRSAWRVLGVCGRED